MKGGVQVLVSHRNLLDISLQLVGRQRARTAQIANLKTNQMQQKMLLVTRERDQCLKQQSCSAKMVLRDSSRFKATDLQCYHEAWQKQKEDTCY